MSSPSQQGRLFRIESGLGEDVLLLRSFRGTEEVSRPFLVHADVLATRSIDATELLEQPICIVIDDGVAGKERFIHGRVRGVTALGRDEEFHAYRIHMVPWLWFLSLYRDCRIFQEMSVPDVVSQVFADRGFADYRIDCRGSFPVREFTVQYRESDLDFVSRLLEEEGIFYFFRHERSVHTLVLADHKGALESSPIQSEVKLSTGGTGQDDERTIHRLVVDTSVHTGKSVLTDYDYLNPSADLSATVPGSGPGSFYDYPGGHKDSGAGRRLAEIRLEVEEARAGNNLRGEGDCCGLIPGYRFNLLESESDDEYLVLEVRHESGTQSYRSGDEGADESTYFNAFTAIPYSTPYRPPRRTPLPSVGLQTAVVVGPSGEEIYTDEYGRVKVRFHWDRESPNDGTSSCWIRVASTWAGNRWGAIQIPRIGQEVIVEFLEGNPDRPLVTGSVYNAQQMPPWSATPTQSGWKSHSTKQGTDESNELRFEDKKGEEEIYVRAEKDLTFEVVNDETGTIGHDRTTTIENDETLTVRNDRTMTIENDETLEVQNDRTRKVSKDETVDIDGKETRKVKGNQTITIAEGNRTIEVKQGNLKTDVKMGNHATKVAMGKATYEAMQSIELKVGANSVKIDQTGITLKGLMVKIDATAMAEVKGPMVKIDGSAMLMAKGGITMIG